MKRNALVLSIMALFILASAAITLAGHGNGGGNGHGNSQSGQSKGMNDMKHMKEMTHMNKKGTGAMDMEVIRTQHVNGLTLTYRLIDMKARMDNMVGMESMAGMEKMASHHLMVDVKKIDGGMTGDAKVGFMVTTPAGATHQSMTMAMKGGYGADIDMKETGTYTVKVKIKSGEDTVNDTFTYTAE